MYKPFILKARVTLDPYHGLRVVNIKPLEINMVSRIILKVKVKVEVFNIPIGELQDFLPLLTITISSCILKLSRQSKQ